MLVVLLFCLAHSIILLFALFLSKSDSELAVNPEIVNLPKNPLCYFVSSISTVNLLQSNVAKYLAWMSDIVASQSICFLTMSLMPIILFSAALRALAVAKSVIICILLLSR